MPVFNAEAYIADALNSLLSQSFSDFEITISDNASVDHTEEICRDFASRDDRIRYHRQRENLGAIPNFNFVFKQSRGTYFKWAAYDDICMPDYLQVCIDVLDRDDAVVWCHTASGKIDKQGQVLTRDDPWAEDLAHTDQAGLPRRHYQSPRRHQRFLGVLLGTNWCVDSYGLIRSEVLGQTSLFPACYGAEKVLMGALSLRGLYHHVPETLFFQRVHPAASSSMNKAADQLTFMDTRASTRFTSTRLQLLRGHVESVIQTPMPLSERALCYGMIARYLLQASKWSTIARNTLAGIGVGRNKNKPEINAGSESLSSATGEQ
jgi:hypothetical protein